jgi:hypothetical protein
VRRAAGIAAALALAAPAFACDLPDDDYATLRRMVSRVKYLRQTETWAEARTREGAQVQYQLSIDQPARRDGLCWWPVEVRADGRLWKRFLVTAGGERVMEDSRR